MTHATRAAIVRRWVWWAVFALTYRRRGESAVRAYREAQKATARLD